MTVPRWSTTATRSTLRSRSGAFDLPSIMVGVAVVAILLAGVLASIFRVIPWAQDEQAKQDVAAVATAQAAYHAMNATAAGLDAELAGGGAGFFSPIILTAGPGGTYASTLEDLQLEGLLPGHIAPGRIGMAGDKDQWAVVVVSQSGWVFAATNTEPGPIKLEALGKLTDEQLASANPLLTFLREAIELSNEQSGGDLPVPELPAEPEAPAPEPTPEPTPEPEPELNPGEPTERPANTGTMITSPGYVYDASWADRTVPESTSTAVTFAFGVTDAYNTLANYDVVWSTANFNAINAKAPVASASGNYGGKNYWVGQVDAGPGGFTEGAGYAVATVTNKTTGETAVKTWALTVGANSIIQGTDGEYYSAEYFGNRTAAASTSTPVVVAFGIKNATADEYDITWSGLGSLGGLTASKLAPASSSYEYRSGVRNYLYTLTPGPDGFAEGVATVTATATHRTSGFSMTKSWQVSVSPVAAVQSTDAYGYAYWPNRTVVSSTSTPVQFAFGIQNASADDFTVVWSGGSGVGATVAPTANYAAMYDYRGGVRNYAALVTPGASGFTTGTATITATATHKTSGVVITKSWTLTVNQVAAVQSTDAYGYAYWPNRAVSSSTSTPVQFAFGIQNATADDFTVVWTGASSVGATAAPTANYAAMYDYRNGVRNYAALVTPSANGFTAGTATITATATHKTSGVVVTKSWTLTVNPVVAVAGTDSGFPSYAYGVDRTVAPSTTAVRFNFGINNAAADDFTVAWSGGGSVGGTVAQAANYSSTYDYRDGVRNYAGLVTPAAGAFTSGTATITATATHKVTGVVVTKTWTLTIS